MSAETQVTLDIEGYLVDPEDWDERIATDLAANEDLELTEEYWSILNFMRAFWVDQKVAPDVRHVLAFMVEEHGYDKKIAKTRLFKLFPYGYVKQACKIAGMRRPRGWSTG
ncbi:MAG TPA: TusE/DsrC/DsvC family sulfur relay protein [Gammaproteobacteria bacterium]|nr:TusE/DsrC/DsvC family sulfur relay protein [Gammaproteobacteria bacterium]